MAAPCDRNTLREPNSVLLIALSDHEHFAKLAEKNSSAGASLRWLAGFPKKQ
jgi:hypothetical protein